MSQCNVGNVTSLYSLYKAFYALLSNRTRKKRWFEYLRPFFAQLFPLPLRANEAESKKVENPESHGFDCDRDSGRAKAIVKIIGVIPRLNTSVFIQVYHC